jgi:pro-kumamolisin-like protein/Big-like domain-containing protein
VWAFAALGGSSWAQTADSVSAGQAPKAVPARITQAVDNSVLFTSKGNVHRMARPEFDQGALPDSTRIKRMQLALKRSDDQQQALKQLMAEQMTKGSPNFHQWLTPQEFGAKFGPADADIQKITGWLGSEGFGDIKVSPSRLVIEFSGNVAQVRNAFHTEIHRFVVNGETHQANTSEPQFPMALSPVVKGIVQLHDFRAKSMRRLKGPAMQGKMAASAQGFVPQFTGTNNDFFAVGPADFAKIYNIPATLDGTGGKIAIVGFSQIDPADVDAFRTLFSLPAKNLNIVLNGEDPGFNAEEGEATLDVQSSGAVAQKAQIDYIVTEGTSSGDPLLSDPLFLGAEYVIFNNTDDVMSLSFGVCELAVTQGTADVIDELWEEAAAQGITVVVSSGDNGSAGCDDFNSETSAQFGLSVNALASTPFNVAVGGTDFDDVGNQAAFWNQNPGANGPGRLSAKGYIHEIAWNDSCAATATSANLTTCTTPDNIVAGSGGFSINPNHPKPDFQTGLLPSGLVPTDTDHRLVPDISLFASDGPDSLSFYIECQADAGASCVPNGQGQFSFLGVGGTSASAPSFAGILALVGQSEANAGRSRRLGNANLVLYNLASIGANSCNSSATPLTGSATCVFYDVTKGNNSVPCKGGAAADCSAATGGVLVTVNGATKTPAFTAAAGTGAVPGYDMATGLGTVNVANLATKWPTATLTATTTTTKVNGDVIPVTVAHNVGVVLSAHVASGGGVPTGDVSFLAPQGTPFGGIGFLPLDGSGDAALPPGTAKTIIPGGTYALKAHYGGDATFAPSDDATGVQVTVTKENSKTGPAIVQFDLNTGNVILPVGATSFSFGSPYILRVDILNTTGTAATCNPVDPVGDVSGCAFDATGTITLTDSLNGGAAVPLDQGTFHVNSAGHIEDHPIDLKGGMHAVKADYSGDVSFNASSTTLNLTVNPATTTTAVTATPNTGVATTTQVTLTATISSQSISLTGTTGTLTFFDGGTAIGNPVPVTPVPAGTSFAGGTATLAHVFATAGNHTITATYNGDTNYAASPASAPVVISVSATTPTFTVVLGGTVPILATAGTTTTVQVPVTIHPTNGLAPGPVQVTCSALPPGVSCSALTIQANSGTTDTIGQLPVALVGPSTTLTAMALPQSGNRIGLVAAGLSSGLAAMLVLLVPGRKRLRAGLGLSLCLMCVVTLALGCSGANNGGGGGPVATTTTITLTNGAKQANGAASFAFNIQVAGGTSPTGTVQILDGATVLGSPTVASGAAMFTFSGTIPVGTHPISAHYMGDSGHMASSSGAINVTVTGNATVTVAAQGATNSPQTQNITVQ